MGYLKRLGVCTIVVLLTASSMFAAADGETLYKRCAGCHGKDGHTHAYGKSGIIAGMDAATLVETLMFYKTSEFKQRGTAHVMSVQLRRVTEEEIKALASYIESLKK